jgi:hypothetical protein
VYFLTLPNPKNTDTCSYGCSRAPIWMQSTPPYCIWVKEEYSDKSIPKPTLQPYLSNFTSQEGAKPYCLPVWYAYRYVRNKDGGYGPMSNWTGYNPADPNNPISIKAGSVNLPCPPGGCAKNGVPFGNKTCSASQPFLSLDGSLDFNVNEYSPDGYSLNVHRQIGYIDTKTGEDKGFNPTSEGEIVGVFYVNDKTQGSTAFFTDILNPNVTDQNSCC